MFGESESESPRVPSPWDSLIELSTSPSPLSLDNLPRLVPENDEGNVEYKLQLLSPSPARFARLVTQLKWRLLEGGGQAYYELGVADSGALVGLPRAELEQSLETLEMMAGEIGASVIVVKEIEMHTNSHYVGLIKTKRLKKIKHITNPEGADDDESTNTKHTANRDPAVKALTRRQVRDRKREEKRRALIAYATSGTISHNSTTTPSSDTPSPSPSPGPVPFTGDEDTHDPTPAETSALVSGLAALHVSVDESPNGQPSVNSNDVFLSGPVEDDEEDNIFVPTPAMAIPLTEDAGTVEGHGSRLIVEALVVRKMSLDEAFLDFGGFMLT
ncbi:hypothetical protein C0995_010910 [Termitomyces sp. Mi166|nr:hypothetical protein C0995_010910 [Termitomyces sp. Mi166\